MKKNFLTIAALSVLSVSAFAQSIEQRVEALETNQLLNAFKFNGTLTTQYDSVEKGEDEDTSAAVAVEEETLSLYRMKFSLDVAAEMDSKFQFYGRLTASKVMNEVYSGKSGAYDTDFTDDFSAGSKYDSSAVYVERAYANIGLIDNLTFSFGRLPTINGSPTQFHDDLPRQGTYPKMAYSAILDGFALSYNYGISSNQKLALRALYTPLNNVKRTGYNGYTQPNHANQSTDKLNQNTSTYTFMADYTQTQAGWADSFNAVAQYVNVNNLEIDDQKTASGYSNSDLFLDYTYVNLYLEALNVFSSGLDIALSHTITTADNKAGGVDVDFSALGGGTNTYGIYCSGEACGEVKGNASLIALKYKLPVAMLKNPSVGLEYLKSDKNYFFNDYSNDDVLDFYTTVGTGMHVYYTQPINSYVKLSVGMMQQNIEHGSEVGLFAGGTVKAKTGILGDRANADVENTSMYARLRADF